MNKCRKDKPKIECTINNLHQNNIGFGVILYYTIYKVNQASWLSHEMLTIKSEVRSNLVLQAAKKFQLFLSFIL